MPATSYTQTVIGDAGIPTGWFVQFQPKIGSVWNLHHVAIKSNNYVSGKLEFELLIGDTFWCGSSTGYNDAADGTPLLVYSYQIVKALWLSSDGSAVFTGPPTFSCSILVDERTQ